MKSIFRLFKFAIFRQMLNNLKSKPECSVLLNLKVFALCKSVKIQYKLQLFITIITLISFSKVNFGQAPDLGGASGFAIFTATGAFSNVGAATYVTGDVGTNAGAFNAFPPGTVIGQIHVVDATSALAATDVDDVYSYFSTLGGSVIGVSLAGQVLTPGVYNTGAASTLNGDLTLDAQGDSDAIFIIRIGGALSTSTFSNVILINSAFPCNVYWQIGGQFDLGDNSVFRGTVVVDGAINLLEGSSLFGRGLSRAGAISLNNNVVNFMPAAAGTIIGTASVCQGQTGFVYTVPLIDNTTGYFWILPDGATITADDNTNSITVDFSSTASSGNITVYGTNACGNGIVSPNYVLTVWLLPLTSAIFHQ